VERQEFDLMAVGRALITDPDWAIKARAGDHGGMKAFETAALAAFH
jgi:2,4-dienoyl-CoA reductase-like NADH-dependent reductase (Old Yellow Enzyme family)